MPEFYIIFARKISKIPEFLWYLPEKLTKFPNFAWFCPKMSNFHVIIAQKIFFPNFFLGGSMCPHGSYTYDCWSCSLVCSISGLYVFDAYSTSIDHRRVENDNIVCSSILHPRLCVRYQLKLVIFRLPRSSRPNTADLDVCLFVRTYVRRYVCPQKVFSIQVKLSALVEIVERCSMVCHIIQSAVKVKVMRHS